MVGQYGRHNPDDISKIYMDFRQNPRGLKVLLALDDPHRMWTLRKTFTKNGGYILEETCNPFAGYAMLLPTDVGLHFASFWKCNKCGTFIGPRSSARLLQEIEQIPSSDASAEVT